MSIEDYVSTVFDASTFDVKFSENGSSSIVASTDIPAKTILFIEHVYVATIRNCMFLMMNHEGLYNSYHPRTDTFENRKDNGAIQSHNKLISNCFAENKKLVVTNKIRLINHSCNPNCFSSIKEIYHEPTKSNLYFEILYSLIDISKGQEITINYGPENSHERDFDCGCGKNLWQRRSDNDACNIVSASYVKFHRKYIKSIISEYIERSETFKNTIMHHTLADRKIILRNGSIEFLSGDGFVFINELIPDRIEFDSDLSQPKWVLDKSSGKAMIPFNLPFSGKKLYSEDNCGKIRIFIEKLKIILSSATGTEIESKKK